MSVRFTHAAFPRCRGATSASGAGLTTVPFPSVAEATVVTEPRLELVKQAGKQYAESGMISEDLLKEITSPMIPEEQYAQIVNGTVS